MTNLNLDHLTEDEALLIIEGEGYTIRDHGLLLSALGRPLATYDGWYVYQDAFSRAAALLESLARNHALVDGNKRTALILTDVYLALMGYDLRPSPGHENFVVHVATGESTFEATAAYLKGYSEMIPPTEEQLAGMDREKLEAYAATFTEPEPFTMEEYTVSFTVTFTPADAEILGERAEAAGLNEIDYLRAVGLSDSTG